MNSIFSSNEDIRKNAYLNWNMIADMDASNFFAMANSFSAAAKCLMNEVLKDNTDKKADSLIFPIFYTANQSIELYLKSILCLAKKAEKGHDLSCFLKKVEEEYRIIFDNDLSDGIPQLKQYIDNLVTEVGTDSKGFLKIDFSRYPKDVKGNDFFYVIRPAKESTDSKKADNVVVDMEEYLRIFDQAVSEIEGIYYEVQGKLSAGYEAD